MSLKSRLLVGGLLLTIFYSSAQSITSPYTNYGIGEISDFSLPHQFGMANVGVSLPQSYYINLQNPALLTKNVLTSFQVGIKADLRSYQTENFSTSDVTASVSHMVLAVPLKKNKWASAVSLLPYSLVNYDLNSIEQVPGTTDSVSNRFTGSGGLSQVSWSHGVRVAKNIRLGARVSYVFGSISKKVSNIIYTLPISDAFTINYDDFVSYSDVVFTLSTVYEAPLSSDRSLHFGMIYDFPGSLNGVQTETLLRSTFSGSPVSDAKEITLDKKVSFQLPAQLSLGVGYENPNKFQVGIDVKLLNWKSFNQAGDSELKNALSLALGAQVTPDYKDVNSYLKRVDYRFGASYKQLPYLINEKEVNDFGINFGVSFPTKNYSSIDTGFKLGSRGTISERLIQENYFQILLGLTINDRWFIKRRYD